MTSASVVIMAFNEEANLPAQIARTVQWFSTNLGDFEVIVVDDGSSDGTGRVADEWAARDPRVLALHHERNRGMGAAIRTGYGAARKEWVTQLPADGQIRPEVFALFLPRLADSPLVLGRYAHRGDGPLRWALTQGFRLACRLALGHPCDFTGTGWVRRELLAETSMDSDSFFANLEFPLGLMRQGIEPAWVTIERPRPREHGSSKVVSPGRIAGVAREILRLRRRMRRAQG
jgi:glycosyltransferase involved in cell wall biosynthesis